MLILSFLSVLVLISFYVYIKIHDKVVNAKRRIDDSLSSSKKINETVKSSKSFKLDMSFLKNPIKNKLERGLTTIVESKLDIKLARAGNPMSVIDFRLLQVIARIGIPILGLLYCILINIGIQISIVVVLLFVALGFVFPNYYLVVKTKYRGTSALRELPDFLDLLCICLESGLGFDSALNRVIEKKSGVLCSEFKLCIDALKLGKSRKESLIDLRTRLDIPEIRSLINSIIQSESLGVSLVDTIKIYAIEERDRQIQRAEEKAMKAPVKILFPLIMFIFPSMFIVMLGPALIQLTDFFK